jgi:exodeoxyribonuclease VII small subunit
VTQPRNGAEKPEDLSFEAAFARLEEVLATLEAGNLPLEQAITLYEEGMKLAQRCQERLEAADLRITQLQARFAEPPPSYEETPARDPEEELFGGR